MRTAAKLIALVLAAMAIAAQKVWDGTRWVARALSGMPTPPSTGIADAFDELTQATAPVTPSAPAAESAVTPSAPAPSSVAAPVAAASAQVVELDPVLARGRLAARFAECTFSLEPEGDVLAECDDVLKAWLLSLNAMEMMAVHRAGAHKVAAHLAGKRLLEDLPEIATDAEFRHYMGQAARITPQRRAEIREFDAAFEDLINDEGYELKCGI
jgi:hypothetical protein